MDIDREIAEKVMGWKYFGDPYIESYYEPLPPHIDDSHSMWTCFPKGYRFVKFLEIWKPSINLYQAMEVVKVLQKKHFHIQIQDNCDFKSFCVVFHNFEFEFEAIGEAPTLELAICIAALKVMNWKK